MWKVVLAVGLLLGLISCERDTVIIRESEESSGTQPGDSSSVDITERDEENETVTINIHQQDEENEEINITNQADNQNQPAQPIVVHPPSTSRVGDVWVSFHLDEVITIRDKDWEVLETGFYTPKSAKAIDHTKIALLLASKNGYKEKGAETFTELRARLNQ